jgi:membrane associated rhomboid family serine protease
MIPIYDTVPSRSKPLITRLLVLINVMAFFYELGLSDRKLFEFFILYGLVPAKYTVDHIPNSFPCITKSFPSSVPPFCTADGCTCWGT